MKKKLLLINPGRELENQAINPGKPWLAPYSLLTVAGMVPPDWDVELWDEFVKGPVNKNTVLRADVFGIGGLTPSRYRAFRIADMIRARGGRVIAGGMDVTGDFRERGGDELLKHYEAIIIGKLTSRLFKVVLDDAERGELQQVYQTEPGEPWEDVIPRHDLIEPDKYFEPAVIRSSAGCNEACHFCIVHQVIGKRAVVITKPAEVLRQELNSLPASPYFPA